jgi:hypothetical protein
MVILISAVFPPCLYDADDTPNFTRVLRVGKVVQRSWTGDGFCCGMPFRQNDV